MNSFHLFDWHTARTCSSFSWHWFVDSFLGYFGAVPFAPLSAAQLTSRFGPRTEAHRATGKVSTPFSVLLAYVAQQSSKRLCGLVGRTAARLFEVISYREPVTASSLCLSALDVYGGTPVCHPRCPHHPISVRSMTRPR